MPVVDIPGGQLHYEADGPRDAPALVLSHSLFFSSEMFAAQAERFAGEYRVVRYDHRGQGGSSDAPADRLDMDTLAADAVALIDALELTPCHFVGNSMGGFVALRIAARHPDRLRSLTVMGSSGEAEGQLAEFEPLVEHIRAQGTADVADTVMQIMFGDTFLSDPARSAERERWRERIIALGPRVGEAAHGVIHRGDVLDELAGASVPMLVLAGEEDHVYAPELSQRVAEAAPDARMVVVPRAGHSVALEEPAAVNELLAEHLQSATAVAAD